MTEGLLLINLGSPDDSSTPAVRRYLRQFLMDRHVTDIHWFWRALLVHGIIAPLRAPKSAHAYQTVWTDEGSPLLTYTKAFVKKVAHHLPEIKVELAMRYGNPTIQSAIIKLRAAGVTRLRVVPLYPQFAKSSSLTAIEGAVNEIKKSGWNVDVSYLQDFYDQPEWISALAANIEMANEGFNADHLLFSYHGLPERHVQQTDRSGQHCLKFAGCCDEVKSVNRYCYRAQCYATTRAAIKKLGWAPDQQSVSFQSRLGRNPWIKPYSDKVVLDLAAKGVKRILVACPSFVADCLETLEEVAIRLREDFIKVGGEELKLVPAPNSSDEWVKDFIAMTKKTNLTWISAAQSEAILG